MDHSAAEHAPSESRIEQQSPPQHQTPKETRAPAIPATATLESIAALESPTPFTQPTVADLLNSPNRQTTPEDSISFTGHQGEYLRKHGNEIMPRETGPFAIAVVSRAYRELSNGNLTEQLISLAAQRIPADQLKAYIAVNNVRSLALAAEVWDSHQTELDTLSGHDRENRLAELVEEEFKKRESDTNGAIRMTQDDRDSLYSRRVPLEKRVQDYRENQATLAVLQSLTTAVNRLTTQPDITHSEITQEALAQIRQSAAGFMTEAQIQTLLSASQAIMKRRIMVMGVDCSSFENAEQEINHGKATNEAAHIAIAQGAQYIDVGDMDEYRAPNALQETLELAQQGSPIDVLIRPLRVVTPQHPEQQRNSPNAWADLVEYYHNALAESRNWLSGLDSTNSGTQIVSAKTFRKHEYPERNMGESVGFARSRRDSDLVVQHAKNSELLLAHRGRDASWFGRNLEGHADRPLHELRQLYEMSDRSTISYLVTQNDSYIQNLNPAELAIYEEQRKRFFNEERERRIQRRRLFLGVRRNGRIMPNGVIPKLYKAWQENSSGNVDDIIHAAHLKPRQLAFLGEGQNPRLVNAVLQELQRIQSIAMGVDSLHSTAVKEPVPEVFGRLRQPAILPLDSCIKYIAQSLPELFGEPLTEEPTYNADAVNQLPPNQINTADWMQIADAIDWTKGYLDDLRRAHPNP